MLECEALWVVSSKLEEKKIKLVVNESSTKHEARLIFNCPLIQVRKEILGSSSVVEDKHLRKCDKCNHVA